MLQKMNEKNTCPSESTINISQNQSKKAKIVTNPIAENNNIKKSEWQKLSGKTCDKMNG